MSRIHVHELLLMGILTALLFIGQVFLAFLTKYRDCEFSHYPLYTGFRQKSIPDDLHVYTSGRDSIRIWSLVVSVSLSLEHPCGNGTAAAPF